MSPYSPSACPESARPSRFRVASTRLSTPSWDRLGSARRGASLRETQRNLRRAAAHALRELRLGGASASQGDGARSQRTVQPGRPLAWMGLAAKFFLAASLMILAVMVVAGRDLQVVRHLVEVHRAIVTRTVPAVQTEAALRQSLQRLRHLQVRYFVLRDARYIELWNVRAHEFTAA